MPIALIFAVVGSLAMHGAALFGTDFELFGETPEAQPLLAEIQPPPPPASPVAAPKRHKPSKSAMAAVAKPAAVEPPAPVDVPGEIAPESPSTATVAPAEPVKAVLPASGSIRYAIFRGAQGFQVGRAEHRWEFTDDGHYRLTGVTETSGLAALLKPVRLEVESVGQLKAGGLQPATYRTRKNGQATTENADFDWAAGEVHLTRDGSVRPIAPGSQDLLSLNYQLAYLERLADGQSIGVVTGRKYERHALDALGEEDIDTPAGRFRTLHLRAASDNVTEIWIALDRQRLPVKIRFTDKKGDSFEQVATELGTP